MLIYAKYHFAHYIACGGINKKSSEKTKNLFFFHFAENFILFFERGKHYSINFKRQKGS